MVAAPPPSFALDDLLRGLFAAALVRSCALAALRPGGTFQRSPAATAVTAAS
jgi:hypothetical protein